MFEDKKTEENKAKKIEVFEDIMKEKIRTTMLLDELPDPTLLKPIGYKGEALDEPLRDDKLNIQMYWKDQNKIVGSLIAIPSFIYLILLLGLNSTIFDGIVQALAWVVNIFI